MKMNSIDRRTFIHSTAAVATLAAVQSKSAMAGVAPEADLVGKLGVTTGSFQRHYAQTSLDGKLRLLDLPKIMRDELGMPILDVMTASFASFDRSYLDAFRNEAEKCGCIITNLKLNQPQIDMASLDPAARRLALDTYKKSIDDAAILGCRWVRPLPLPELPSWENYIESYRELIDDAKPKGITLLVENFGWIMSKVDAVPGLIEAVGDGLKACPDIGNWGDEFRYEGLANAFPHAVTCDFKAFTLDSNGHHSKYDLKRCFDIGWDAGFRGPWCFEHFHTSLKECLREMVILRDQLTRWIDERQKN